jgi:transposase
VDTSKVQDTSKRRYRSVELKRQIVEETFEAGTSVAVVARRHAVNANQVFSWRRQYQRGELVGTIEGSDAVPLLPVQIHHESTPVASDTSGTHEGLATEDCLEIEFSGGRHIRVWGRADPEVLRTAIRELSQL